MFLFICWIRCVYDLGNILVKSIVGFELMFNYVLYKLLVLSGSGFECNKFWLVANTKPT